jgi:hypothetical protein
MSDPDRPIPAAAPAADVPAPIYGTRAALFHILRDAAGPVPEAPKPAGAVLSLVPSPAPTLGPDAGPAPRLSAEARLAALLDSDGFDFRFPRDRG